jgi:mono/diheme cytochrome c family protein
MRRTALLLVLLVAAVGVLAAGCGGEESQSAAPETVEGTTSETTTTETTETETTATSETESTESETTETTTTETAPAGQGDPAAGKQVFLGAPACGGCHTLADAGTSGNVGPNLDDAMPPYDLVVDRVTNGQGGMPSFKGTLTPQQIQDVAAYVSSVAGK